MTREQMQQTALRRWLNKTVDHSVPPRPVASLLGVKPGHKARRPLARC